MLFNETDRFRPLIFNNMKGKIVGISQVPGKITFDIDLARSQSNDNPVYYVQYAHARCASILRNAAEQGVAHAAPDVIGPPARR